jgi:hypothetical protein
LSPSDPDPSENVLIATAVLSAALTAATAVVVGLAIWSVVVSVKLELRNRKLRNSSNFLPAESSSDALVPGTQ